MSVDKRAWFPALIYTPIRPSARPPVFVLSKQYPLFANALHNHVYTYGHIGTYYVQCT